MALSQLVKMIQGQATVDAMGYSVAVTAVIVFAAIILTLFMKNKKTPKKQDKEGEKNESQGGFVMSE